MVSSVSPKPSNGILEHIKPVWVRLTGAAVAIGGAIEAFSFAPPLMRGDARSSLPAFATFAVVMVVALLLVIDARYQAKKHAWRWGAVAAAAFVAGSIGYFLYHSRLDAWSAPYVNVAVIVGSREQLTDVGRLTVKEMGVYDKERLVTRAAGVPADMWREAQLEERLLILQAIYLAYTTILACAVLAAIIALVRSGAVNTAAPAAGNANAR